MIDQTKVETKPKMGNLHTFIEIFGTIDSSKWKLNFFAKMK